MRDYDKPVTNPEPLNGAKVAVYKVDGQWKVIHRDDARAAHYAQDGCHIEDRWFEDYEGDDDAYRGEDGMGWQAHLKYAEAFYVIDPAARVEVTR